MLSQPEKKKKHSMEGHVYKKRSKGFVLFATVIVTHCLTCNRTTHCVNSQTQEREAKAEMRRKAKELQQARRDAERSGKKVPAFGGFGSAGMSSVSSGSVITDSIVEPEKPKISAAPVRWDPG